MYTPSKSIIALVQMDCAGESDDVLSRAIGHIRAAADQGARIVCLPELFRSLYFCQTEDVAAFALAEPLPGPTTVALGKIAKEKRVAVLAPVFERRAAGIYHNSLALLNECGELAGVYRKMHIPDDPQFHEKFYFTPGDLGFKAFDTETARIGTLICWDQWYPEAARLTALQGAAVLFYPTAIGWLPEEKEACGEAQYDAWLTVQRGHAIANGVYVAAVNRIGFEPTPDGSSGIEFWGRSFIADPQGVVLAQASTDREEIVLAEIDLAHLELIRRTWPFFRDRRIDAYGGLEQRWGVFIETHQAQLRRDLSTLQRELNEDRGSSDR